MSPADNSSRPSPLAVPSAPLFSPINFPPASLTGSENGLHETTPENMNPYFSALPLSPRRGAFSPDVISTSQTHSQTGLIRAVTVRQRGYSDSSSFSPIGPGKSQAERMRPMYRRQRGYSDSSSFSEFSVSSAGRGVHALPGLRESMISQQPQGLGRNSKLDDTALRGIWDIYRKEAGDYDSAMMDSLKASIDNLILFAGLFSGIITTFLVESYKSLAPPRPNTSHPIEDVCRMFGCGPHTVRINTMWFTSLGLSLVSGLIAMLARQWIVGYMVELPFSGPHSSEWSCRLRQFRYDGMKEYKMAEVIAATPILLHAALLCFCIGLVDFLWNLNRTVAIPFSCLCALTLIFYIGTTISAVVSPRSPFKTALARLICNLCGGHMERERVQAAGIKMDEDVIEWLISTARSSEIYQEATQALAELKRMSMSDPRAV